MKFYSHDSLSTFCCGLFICAVLKVSLVQVLEFYYVRRCQQTRGHPAEICLLLFLFLVPYASIRAFAL
jgi:hypothetical protein